MQRFKKFLSEAYSFFPKKESEISATLGSWDDAKKEDLVKLLNFLKAKFPSIEQPINIDPKKPGMVNVARALQDEMSIADIKKESGITSFNIKFGNGSSGNRGVNNRGNLFEPQFAQALENWWAGEEVDKNMLAAIEDLNKEYDISNAEKFTVNVVGGENTRRPLEFGSKIVLSNTKGSGFDIGTSVTDITLNIDDKEVYLSLKLGGTTTFFNVGVRTILTPQEIKSGKIRNVNGLKLLKLFGIDPDLFCQVFNGTLEKQVVDKNAKYDKSGLETLLQSGIGYGYHVIHKKGKKIDSYNMSETKMKSAARPGKVTIYYGGKTGKGKRVNVEFESSMYKFSINIRDTQGKDGYPTRMMCDFKSKQK